MERKHLSTRNGARSERHDPGGHGGRGVRDGSCPPAWPPSGTDEMGKTPRGPGRLEDPRVLTDVPGVSRPQTVPLAHPEAPHG